MQAGKSFFVTTPIFYVNDVPHIGHAYTEVAADVLARWHRQSGDDTWLLTGTDEHGQKILRTAAANGLSPKAWADRLVENAWMPLLETLNISADDFIRTTEPRHEEAVAHFLQKLYDEGYIYPGEYEGYYCVGCEEYKQLDELDLMDEGEYAGKLLCRIHSRPVEILKEKNYFFRMSQFEKQLLELYENQPNFIRPDSVRNEIIQFVRQGLSDLSISRSSFDWGIKVPWDDEHVVYVWFDALLNYLTATGYPNDPKTFTRRWPVVNLVGKDIARFHAVIWPAMLMAAGLPVPKHVFGHGWLLVGGEKMSKSKLTGISPKQITEVFGSDAFRYYFMRAISFGQDGSFSWEDLSARYQAELANGFGNLASRIIAMLGRYYAGVVPAPENYSDADLAIQQMLTTATKRADRAIESFAIHEAISEIWAVVDALNGYLTQQQPWILAKDDSARSRLGTVLYTATETLRALAVLLSPIMPNATTKLWTALGAKVALGELSNQNLRQAGEWGKLPADLVTEPLEPLFPRIEETQEAGAA